MRISNMLGATMIAGAPSTDACGPGRAESLTHPEPLPKPRARRSSTHRLRPGRTRGRLGRSNAPGPRAPLPDQTI